MVSFPQDALACYAPSSKRLAARTDVTRHLYQAVIFADEQRPRPGHPGRGVIAAPALSLTDDAGRSRRAAPAIRCLQGLGLTRYSRCAEDNPSRNDPPADSPRIHLVIVVSPEGERRCSVRAISVS